MAPEDVCFYQIRAECGIPAFKPGNTDYIKFISIEYDDSSLTFD